MAPLTSVILGSVLVYLIYAEKHGVQVIGHLKKGLNPLTVTELAFGSPHLSTAIKTGIITGVISLAEGIAVGRSPFSRTAVNFNAGCKSAVSNIIMATAVMITLLFLTPLFHYTPFVVLSSIIIVAMLGLIDYKAAFHLWKLDKFDFVVCICSYIGVVFGSIEIGLVVAVTMSLLRVLISVARPRTTALGNIPNSMVYRSIDEYPNATKVPGVLILQINGSIYFANANYLRERITRWIYEEVEDKLKATLQYVILDMSAVGNIDTSGIRMLQEIKKNSDRMGLKTWCTESKSRSYLDGAVLSRKEKRGSHLVDQAHLEREEGSDNPMVRAVALNELG
ncbi:hypothetical protein CRG98_038271 [Punica granatum]|uniref:STAS domain-containing protein n=1 Tax=Punica granatum TaxID=22663 RepID=A0A2I0IBH2_PUNGR|nr:hypothetical protein CRG98_038271 [Punica granatum]